MKRIQFRLPLALLLTGALAVGCTKLEENLNNTATQAQSDALFAAGGGDLTILLQSCYDGLRTFQGQDGPTSLMENSSDESLVPTRGPDWDDNGVWRVIHSHNWDADHTQVGNTFNGLLQIVFNCTNVLNFLPKSTAANKEQVGAEARFIRAFAMFTVLDLYGQVPFRDPGEDLRRPSRVLKPTEAVDFILAELGAIRANLPNSSGVATASRATKDACDMLRMKVLLQRGTYTNRQAPTFATADMAAVITLADGIISSGRYSLSANVWDNYAPSNGTISTENIFTNLNVGGSRGGELRSSWYKTQHYKMNKGSWNGFSTLAEVYNKFESTDTRRGVAYPTGSATIRNDSNRINTGFLIGQQYDLSNDTALTDRTRAPLVFVPTVSLRESGANLEVTGIRVNRYPIDYGPANDAQADNDYVFYRYADVLLMKAEAQFRSGNTGGALVTVNSLRTVRGASPFSTLTAMNILDERQREFYWDGWRRMDMIRFGTFLAARTLKPNVSNVRYLYFPIPTAAVAVNPNLTQNPGY